MVNLPAPSSLQREKWLTALNLAVVSWLFGLNGVHVLHTIMVHLVSTTGLMPPDDVASVMVALAVMPLLLPVGWIGGILYVNVNGDPICWLFFIANAGLWAIFVSFFWRLIETGDFQTARDASFPSRRRRRFVHPAPPDFEQPPA